MSKFKPLDYELLFELMKNARKSDRESAKVLDISQSTVSRMRNFLEKELIEGYTVFQNGKS
jgi:DNA-binding Lrp family transcriptional regulator